MEIKLGVKCVHDKHITIINPNITVGELKSSIDIELIATSLLNNLGNTITISMLRKAKGAIC